MQIQQPTKSHNSTFQSLVGLMQSMILHSQTFCVKPY